MSETHMILHFKRLKSSPNQLPDSKLHGANMGLTWVLSAPDGPHVGPMNLAISEDMENEQLFLIIFNNRRVKGMKQEC